MTAWMHWAAWLGALALVALLIVKIGEAWAATVQRSKSNSGIRKIDRPARLLAWVIGVFITLAFGVTFPLNTVEKKEGRDCRLEFDNRGQAVECD